MTIAVGSYFRLKSDIGCCQQQWQTLGCTVFQWQDCCPKSLYRLYDRIRPLTATLMVERGSDARD